MRLFYGNSWNVQAEKSDEIFFKQIALSTCYRFNLNIVYFTKHDIEYDCICRRKKEETVTFHRLPTDECTT